MNADKCATCYVLRAESKAEILSRAWNGRPAAASFLLGAI